MKKGTKSNAKGTKAKAKAAPKQGTAKVSKVSAKRTKAEDKPAARRKAPAKLKGQPADTIPFDSFRATTNPFTPAKQPLANLRLDTASLSEVKSAAAHTRVENPIPRTGSPILGKGNDPFQQSIEQMLNIKWSRYIQKTPLPKQIAAMMLAHMPEVLYGGALGGGKSDWLSYEALRFCDLPGFSAIIFRRQLTDLKQPNSLIPRIAVMLEPFRQQGFCRYVGDEHVWVFKTVYPGTDIPGPEARLQFGYIGEAAVRERYQSAEYQLVCFDELGQWPEDIDYLFMRSRIRKLVCPEHGKNSDGSPRYVLHCPFCDTLSATPSMMRAATNPGPAWIKRRFGIVPDPSQFPNRHAALIAIAEGHKIKWIGTNPSRPFIPAYLEDNWHLNEQEYRVMLAEMSPEERSRLEDGNWEARKDARFKRRWQRFCQVHHSSGYFCYEDIDVAGNSVVSDPIPFKALSKIYTTVDPAVTVKEGPVDLQVKQKNSHAVISTWGETMDHNLIWLDCRKFKKEIPDLVEELVDVNMKWRPRYNKIECNGVGVGLAQYAERAGLPVAKNYRKSDKIENSLCAQMMMKNGRIFIPTNTPWAETVEDDVFSWTGLPTEEDDVIDTLADAAIDIAPGIAREMSAPALHRSRPISLSTSGPLRGTIPHYGL